MGKSLQEVLHENKERVYKKRMEELKKQRKREERKEVALFCIIVGFIATLTIAGIIATSDDLNRCKTLHNENYCIEHL